MDSIYILIPVTTLLLGIAVAAYFWSVNSGQFEDLDKAARSILFEDADNAPARAEEPGEGAARALPAEPRPSDSDQP